MGPTNHPTWISRTALEHARANGELSLVYQPKIELASGALCGVEALMRWRHPEHGYVGPDSFIAAAERLGAIDMLTDWAFETALGQLVSWRAAGLVTGCAVNVSPLNLDRSDLPDFVEALAAQHGVPADDLTIELTETAAQKTVRLMEAVTRFRLKGMHISLDDFGIGYSSLAQLQRLPFDELKIDKSFLADADRARDSRIIIKSIIDLAHNLGLQVTAEGVETAAAMDLLVALGCDKAQGYYIAKPMPGAALLDWAAQRMRIPC